MENLKIDVVDNKTVRELTEKYRGRKVIFQKPEGEVGKTTWTDYIFEGVISHFTGLRNISVEYENELCNVHDENFVFVD